MFLKCSQEGDSESKRRIKTKQFGRILVLKTSCLSLIVVFFSACQEPLNKRPESPTHAELANVFIPLDGMWRGKFYVYTNPEGQSNSTSQPRELDKEYLQALPLVIHDSVEVEQHYYSKGPFLQQVKIKDTYFPNGEAPKTVQSEGYNQVKDGRLVCVINKPSGRVMHSGNWDRKNTITWERSEHDPRRMEFFQETVEDSTYTILGWGYYDEDDPDLSPKTWFYGEYYRVE